jgi:hypothetical protein
MPKTTPAPSINAANATLAAKWAPLGSAVERAML